MSLKTLVGSGSGSGSGIKKKFGSGSGINHSGSATLLLRAMLIITIEKGYLVYRSSVQQ